MKDDRITALQSSVACPAGQTYIREAGTCMTVQQPGEPCQYSQQCSALEPGAYCLKMRYDALNQSRCQSNTASRCECVYGMKKSSNGCTFVNNDCKERGHIFISEIGECREGNHAFSYHYNLPFQLSVIPPGGKGCSHNLQCSGAYPDATCFMQTCTCPPNLPVAADGTCGRACPDKQVYSGVTGECLPSSFSDLNPFLTFDCRETAWTRLHLLFSMSSGIRRTCLWQEHLPLSKRSRFWWIEMFAVVPISQKSNRQGDLYWRWASCKLV